jgi:flagellar FliL protein
MASGGEADSASKIAGAKPAKMGLVPLLALVFGILMALAGGVSFYLMNGFAKGQEADTEWETKTPNAEPIYVDLAPPFTVNFQSSRGPRFLQIAVEVMTRGPEIKDLLKQHMPVIRSQLVLLFSSQSSEELATREGKEKLIQQTLATIQEVLKKETGKKGVEAVYFTSLVMQ